MARVVHFEITADDPERATEFYANVFGWKIQKWDGPQDYWLATTGAPDTPGIDGAIMRRDSSMPAVVNTIDVTALDAMIAAVTANGGTVVAPRMTIPGVGIVLPGHRGQHLRNDAERHSDGISARGNLNCPSHCYVEHSETSQRFSLQTR